MTDPTQLAVFFSSADSSILNQLINRIYFVVWRIETTGSTESVVSIDASNSADFSFIQNKESVYKDSNLCESQNKQKVEPN